ncbi:lipopolysaccharide heptosyltransferase II [Oxalobacteraceae bacterium OTU3REALA1]|nr:lipopolysaccharide heptosyltransferase II [Oxalobacteraceae bacterium OTU3REALA1]
MDGRQARGDGKSAWSGATRILCVRLDNMGDVLMCTPAMRALVQALPGSRLTLLASPVAAAVARFIPELHDVLTYSAPWVKGCMPADADETREFVGQLRASCFDGAVIFSSFSQSALPAALLCFQAGIPLRLAHCRENPYQLLTDWVRDPEPEQGIRHEVLRQLSLVAHIGCRADNERLSFAVRDADLEWMRWRLRSVLAGAARPWVLMHPGASASSRRYPAAHWAGVVRRLTTEQGVQVVLSGEAGDAELIAAIIRESGVSGASAWMGASAHSLAGELDLGKLGAAIALAPLFVSNNTGPAHIAAALGTPVVELYALTNPQHTPWQVESRVLFHDVPCRYCYKSVCPQGHHQCLAGVEPGRVAAAVRSLLAIRPGPPPRGGPAEPWPAADPTRTTAAMLQSAAPPRTPQS